MHYAIGDLQGCYDPLCHLLDEIDYAPERDTLWFTGDLINRGPRSLETLRLLFGLPQERVIITLGNHDLHFLAVALGVHPIKPNDTFQDILSAPDCMELTQWLRKQKLLHCDPDLKIVMTHAGIPPRWSLSECQSRAALLEEVIQGEACHDFFSHLYGNTPDHWQDHLSKWEQCRLIANGLTRMRYCFPDGRLELHEKGSPDSAHRTDLLPWFQLSNRMHEPYTIVFGHWAALNGVTHTQGIEAIDTGCVWGKCLTALNLKTFERHSVPAKRLT